MDIALVDRLVPLVLGRLGVEDRRLGVVFDGLGGKRIDVFGIPPHGSVDNVVGERTAVRDVLIEALVGRVGNHAPELLVRDIALVADPELAIGPRRPRHRNTRELRVRHDIEFHDGELLISRDIVLDGNRRLRVDVGSIRRREFKAALDLIFGLGGGGRKKGSREQPGLLTRIRVGGDAVKSDLGRSREKVGLCHDRAERGDSRPLKVSLALLRVHDHFARSIENTVEVEQAQSRCHRRPIKVVHTALPSVIVPLVVSSALGPVDESR